MGMSRASSGSPSNVPMVPPWVPDVPADEPSPAEESDSSPDADDEANSPDQKPSPIPIAPVGRFRSTRATLGRFATSGRVNPMRRGIGQYVRTGLGGPRVAARRFGGTARTAGTLYGVLGGDRTGAERKAQLD